MIIPHGGDTVRSSGDQRNGIPRTFYTYRGDGHDSLNPEKCECGKCGRRRPTPDPDERTGQP